MPFEVLPLFCLPADSLLPGQTPAHLHRLCWFLNLVMSAPVSAMICSAATLPTPGISSSAAAAAL
ncbi:MAG: hypothetical protein FWG34_09455 [Oscillospiraceae bacterium]|nr:hypothetical protein [Oscillospiraceae bacterium]